MRTGRAKAYWKRALAVAAVVTVGLLFVTMAAVMGMGPRGVLISHAVRFNSAGGPAVSRSPMPLQHLPRFEVEIEEWTLPLWPGIESAPLATRVRTAYRDARSRQVVRPPVIPTGDGSMAELRALVAATGAPSWACNEAGELSQGSYPHWNWRVPPGTLAATAAIGLALWLTAAIAWMVFVDPRRERKSASLNPAP